MKNKDVFEILKEMRSIPADVTNPNSIELRMDNPNPKLHLYIGHRMLFREYANRIAYALKCMGIEEEK